MNRNNRYYMPLRNEYIKAGFGDNETDHMLHRMFGCLDLDGRLVPVMHVDGDWETVMYYFDMLIWTMTPEQGITICLEALYDDDVNVYVLSKILEEEYNGQMKLTDAQAAYLRGRLAVLKRHINI